MLIRCGVALQQGTRVEVEVERAPNNSRRLFASVDVAAPVEVHQHGLLLLLFS